MSTLRCAVVGCGMISEFHLRAWQRLSNVDVVALCDPDVGRAEDRRCLTSDARIYTDLDALLSAESLDFVDVLTPPSHHKTVCLRALAAGMQVICQKPIAESLDEARELAAAFANSDRRLAIHENHRYRPWFQKIIEFDKEGFFGTKRYARFTQFDPHEPAEVYKLEARRGILLEYGTHIVDMIHALFGRPTSVAGSAYHLNDNVRGESLVHLTFSCGDATATLDLAWKSSGLGHGGVVLVGDRGEAIYEGTMSRGAESRFRLVRGNDVVLDEHRSPLEDYADSFYRFQSAFVDALSGSSPLPQPAGLNLSVMETTFAAYEAIETGEVIRLNPA